MKTHAIQPADVDFTDPAVPRAPAFDDLYHPRQGAFAQARHVFLAGNDLPARWAGRSRFVVLETGFGLGNNFLATWAAWRADPARAERLVFLSLEKHPLRADDLRRAQAASPEPALAAALCDAWPPLTAGLHRLAFDEGRVELLLALGDIHDLLPALVADVDAFFLDGFAPARNPQMWDEHLFRTIARLAAPEATAATWSAAAVVRDGLRRAGFVVDKAPGSGGKRDITVARFVPRVPARRPAFRAATTARPRRVAVVGAGLAGAFAARALAAEGLEVLVLDRADAPASEASGNAAGLFHGVIHPDDGPHARAHRAAALLAHETYARACAQGVPGRLDGLLRLEADASPEEVAEAWRASGLPRAYVEPWAPEAVQAAGGPSVPAWFFPGGGWVSPTQVVAWALDVPGVTFRGGVEVRTLRRRDGAWEVSGVDRSAVTGAAAAPGAPVPATWLATVDAVVIAGGVRMSALLADLAADGAVQGEPLPALVPTRGQVGILAADTPGLRAPRLAVAGGGYALTLPDGRVLFGATTHVDDPDPTLRDEDHARNLAQLAAVTGSSITADVPSLLAAGRLSGRVGWRATTPDRLPWIGALPAAWAPSGERRPDQPRHWPRVPGLFVVGGFGSRGLTWAPLAGRLVASWITDAPYPLESDLVAALDPARVPARASRRPATPAVG
jgi:tRNA 5-methylaminomethyl-2-thiouridine biosynthesis bifunctional protein